MWHLGNKENIFLWLYHAFHPNDSLIFHQFYTAWWYKHLEKQLPKIKARNKSRHFYFSSKDYSFAFVVEAPVAPVDHKGSSCPWALLTSPDWNPVAACKNHGGFIKHSEEKKILCWKSGYWLPVALAGGCWSLPVEGEFHPRAWHQQDQPPPSPHSLAPDTTPPPHPGLPFPQGSTVPATMMGFLIFKALQHPEFISRGNPFHLVTSSQAHLPEVYCSLSWKVKHSELS